MAQVISSPVRGRDPESEIKVYRILRGLPDNWSVFHSVNWLGTRGKRIGDGEADFVLLHPAFGLIALEVKGGGVSTEHGEWVSEDRNRDIHKIKDPYKQASESARNLHEWLKDRLGCLIPAVHAVVFPDLSRIPSTLPPNAPPEITITSGDFRRVEQKLHEILKKHKISQNLGLNAKQTRKVINALAPTTRVRRTLSDEASDADRGLINLTEEQIRAFAGTRRNRRMIILGAAGTGKTVLAVEKARQLRDDGRRTLLVCYNNLLQKRLSADRSLDGITVKTFHGLCYSQIEKAGMETPQNPIPEEWWKDKAPDELVSAVSKTGDTFEAIVVDEGQDFSKLWLDALECISRYEKETPFYIFADKNQDLWRRNWENLEDEDRWSHYELALNCRNTREISLRVEAIGGSEVWEGAASGPQPKWTELGRGSVPSTSASKIVDELLRKNFSPNEIVVLCEDRKIVNDLRGKSVGETEFAEFGRDGVVIETIGRFKGLEAKVAVVVLGSGGESPDRIAYVGFSRAKTYLHVIAPRERKKPACWS